MKLKQGKICSFLLVFLFLSVPVPCVVSANHYVSTSISSSSTSVAVDPRDRAALLELKSHLQNPLHSWDGDGYGWTGFTFSNRSGRLTSLNLTSLNLSGQFHPSLCNLSFLETLTLSRNSLHGSLPSCLNLLQNLRILDLSYNAFGGSPPQALAALNQLTELDLSHNAFSGEIPVWIGNFSLKLVKLNLGFNNFHGEMPKSLYSAMPLLHLDLSHNSLTGIIGDFQQPLLYLNLESNLFAGTLPYFLSPCPLYHSSVLQSTTKLMRFPLNFFSRPSPKPSLHHVPLFLLLILADSAYGFGSMGPISASFGDYGLFCAIDASGKQAVICWDANNSSSVASSSSRYSTVLPPMAALSGGKGFLCGILAENSQALCWDSMGFSKSSDLVPAIFQPNAYSHIAAGNDHVCAIRGSYYSDNDSGTVDCWDIDRVSNNTLSSKQSDRFYDQNASILVFRKLVSGDGFSCGVIRDGGISCWGPKSGTLGVSGTSETFLALTSSLESICGVLQMSGEVKCWGNNSSNGTPPFGIRFVSLSASAQHYCGIREDTHGIECWGNFNASLIPKGPGFLAIASSNLLTCGIREGDLVLDCWFANESSQVYHDPPLQLCSPGLCTAGSCGEGMFAFNASLLNEPDLTSLCVREDLKICSPCGLNCSKGFFPSSICTLDADRVCTPCSLCQNSSCEDVCSLHSLPGMKEKHWDQLHQLLLIIGSSVSGFILILIAWCILPRVMVTRNKEGKKKRCLFCFQSPNIEADEDADQHPIASVATCPGVAQVFRLTELKDATNGFKEFNELGRGSYGFVYKAVLPDGRQLAVKRANAATIIHTNSRDFEMELEILCNVRHSNIVNLLGYCSEMGERLLVYEFMPHGTLHDHLHGGLSTLNWNLRLKIAMQAAKGLEYLHKEVVPPIVHRDVKCSKILLDADWGARISDFGLLTPNERDLSADMRMDVYGFGVVLLEILSGRKAYDEECTPPNIVEWALPQIREGKAAAIIDRYVPLPRNVEPLLKLAEIAELATKDDINERANMSDLALLLDPLAKDGLTF